MQIKINVDKRIGETYKELAEDAGEDLETWCRAALAAGVEALQERNREVLQGYTDE